MKIPIHFDPEWDWYICAEHCADFYIEGDEKLADYLNQVSNAYSDIHMQLLENNKSIVIDNESYSICSRESEPVKDPEWLVKLRKEFKMCELEIYKCFFKNRN